MVKLTILDAQQHISSEEEKNQREEAQKSNSKKKETKKLEVVEKDTVKKEDEKVKGVKKISKSIFSKVKSLATKKIKK